MTRPRRAALGLALAWGCSADPPGVVDGSATVDEGVARATHSDPRADVYAALAAYEDELRAEIDPGAVAPWPAGAGADPFAIVGVAPDRALGLVRGQGAIVLLDGDARELARVEGPAEPVAIAAGRAGEWFVVGERPDWREGDEPGSTLATVRMDGDRPTVRRVRVPGVLGLRDVAFDDRGVVVLADRVGGRILAVRWPQRGRARRSTPLEVRELARCEGAIDVDVHDGLVVAVCLLERSLWFGELDASGLAVGAQARIVRDGPHWAAAVRDAGDGWLVAATSVEDRPLDREGGAFGWVDPHVTIDEVRRCTEGLCVTQRASVNMGEHGVVMPKWIQLAVEGDRALVAVTGYGADRAATLTFDRTRWPDVRVATSPVPPGLRALAKVGAVHIGADPLLDTWVLVDGHRATTVPIPGPVDPRGPAERVGEALVFTHLLAPGASSDGRKSRFTCETCHFEGTVDGRIHYTGRGDVHATTKSLFGLFPNRPHFTRALDRTLATMVDNEFAVANRGDPHGADFAVDPARTPWLRELGVVAPMGPVDLRRAMMRFFAGFAHAPNPAVLGRDRFTVNEARGAALFRDHCERCHAARVITDDPATRVPFPRWAELVLSERGPIVWASEVRVRTGIEPYVHDEGARPPSLRRMGMKRPYFTDGSAATLDDVLARAHVDTDSRDTRAPTFTHDGSAKGTKPLAESERAALRAFLELL